MNNVLDKHDINDQIEILFGTVIFSIDYKLSDNFYLLIKTYPKLKFKTHDADDYPPSNNGFNQFFALTKNLVLVHFSNDFNQFILLPKVMNELFLGYNFKQIFQLSKYMFVVKFGNVSNCISNYPKSTKCLTYLYEYNVPLSLSKNIRCLYLGRKHNWPIGLSKNIKYLTIKGLYTVPIVFTKHLEHLYIEIFFPMNFKKFIPIHVHFDSCPSLKLFETMYFNMCYQDNLSNDLKIIKMVECASKKLLINLPSNVVVQIQSSNYRFYMIP